MSQQYAAARVAMHERISWPELRKHGKRPKIDVQNKQKKLQDGSESDLLS
jgi:hypothetical protein